MTTAKLIDVEVLKRARNALALHRSMILSGEVASPTSDQIFYDAVLGIDAALAAPHAEQPVAELLKQADAFIYLRKRHLAVLFEPVASYEKPLKTVQYFRYENYNLDSAAGGMADCLEKLVAIIRAHPTAASDAPKGDALRVIAQLHDTVCHLDSEEYGGSDLYKTCMTLLNRWPLDAPPVNEKATPPSDASDAVVGREKCKTCNGHGLIGAMTLEGGEGWPCPECDPIGASQAPAAQAKLDDLIASVSREAFEVWAKNEGFDVARDGCGSQYRSSFTNGVYLAWLACLQRTQPSADHVVAWVSIQPDRPYWTEDKAVADEWMQRGWNVIGYAAPAEYRSAYKTVLPKPSADQGLDVGRMVDAFLNWPLPKSVRPDGCVFNSEYSSVGTHLLSANEARQMFEHVLRALAGREKP